MGSSAFRAWQNIPLFFSFNFFHGKSKISVFKLKWKHFGACLTNKMYFFLISISFFTFLDYFFWILDFFWTEFQARKNSGPDIRPCGTTPFRRQPPVMAKETGKKSDWPSTRGRSLRWRSPDFDDEFVEVMRCWDCLDASKEFSLAGWWVSGRRDAWSLLKKEIPLIRLFERGVPLYVLADKFVKHILFQKTIW